MPLLLTAALTKSGVDRVDVRAKQYRIWDKEVPDLYLRVFPNGRKVYELSADYGPITLGDHPTLSPTLARKMARTKAVLQFLKKRRELLSTKLTASRA